MSWGTQQMYSTRGVVIDVTSRAACDKEKNPAV